MSRDLFHVLSRKPLNYCPKHEENYICTRTHLSQSGHRYATSPTSIKPAVGLALSRKLGPISNFGEVFPYFIIYQI